MAGSIRVREQQQNKSDALNAAAQILFCVMQDCPRHRHIRRLAQENSRIRFSPSRGRFRPSIAAQ
jgi:hypothetical protein